MKRVERRFDESEMTGRQRSSRLGDVHSPQAKTKAPLMSTGTTMTPGPVSRSTANQTLTDPLFNGDILYEVVDDEIRELPPMSARETQFATDLARLVGNHAWAAKLGKVQAEMLFLVDKSRNRQMRPDVSYLSFDRWPKGRPVPQTSAWEVVPDLAVEIVSPTDGANEVLGKVEDYFAGVGAHPDPRRSSLGGRRAAGLRCPSGEAHLQSRVTPGDDATGGASGPVRETTPCLEPAPSICAGRPCLTISVVAA
jgi:Uma2 family endonuclease